MKKQIIIIFLTFMLPVLGMAQEIKKHDLVLEDVLITPQFNGVDMAVYGVYLGMKKTDAKTMINLNSMLAAEKDEYNTKSVNDEDTKELRLYIYEKDSNTGKKGNCLLYLIWNDGSTGIDKIMIFKDFSKYAKGMTAKLFTKDVVDENSDFYKKYLGKSTGSKLGSYTNNYFYQNKNIEIIEYKDTENYYYFGLTKKAN